MPELMKGKVWHDRKHKMTYPCRAEVKYDEIRCHVKVRECVGSGQFVEFWSYAGKPLANMDLFDGLFLHISRITGYTEFDCGFEVNGNFNDSYRWVRSTRGLPDDLVGASTRFILFDLPQLVHESYSCRLFELEWCRNVASKYPSRTARLPPGWRGRPGMNHLDVPHGLHCENEADVDAFFLWARENRFEGAMVKSYDHTYQPGKRIDGWLKMKPEDDADGEIVELLEAHATVDDPEHGIAAGDPLGRIGSVRVRMEDGSEACPHGIAHDLGREMYLNPQAYIGQWVEFKFMERDRQGGYRHPTFSRFREDKQ